MGVIYKITNIQNGKSYIGQTKNFKKRMKQHFSSSDNYVIHCAVRKYGADNFTTEILEECDDTLLDTREQYWIKYWDSYNDGYNMTLGGDNSSALDNWRANNPDLAKANALNGLYYANKWNEEHKKESLEHIKKIQLQGIEARRKKVKCVDLNLEFDSLSQAEKWSKSDKNPNGKIAHHQHISKVCNGKRNTAGGYCWEYV